MTRIRRWLRRLLLAVAALLAVTVMLVGLSRLTTPTAAQRDVLALMERDELPDGPDAYGILYTQGRDVPYDEIETVLAADAATVAGWPESWEVDTWEPGRKVEDYVEWRLDDYPSLSPSREDSALFCQRFDETSCLAQVRAAPDATAAALARNEGLLARAGWLRDAEVVRNAMPHIYAPWPGSPAPGALPLMTVHALAFVQGDERYAISETCRDLVTWRRLATNTDMLTTAIDGIVIAGDGYARLLADMTSEWPVDRPLPAACEAALVPPDAEELLMCNVLRGEFQISRRLHADNQKLITLHGGWLDRVTAKLLYDDQATVAELAALHAPYCRTKRPGRLNHDRPEPGLGALLRWSCMGNLGGCAMAALSSADAYDDYADRMRDFGARLRLLGALAWMREQAAESGVTADTLVDRLPAELTDAEQRIALAPDGRALRVALFFDTRGEWAEVPLPAALVPKQR